MRRLWRRHRADRRRVVAIGRGDARGREGDSTAGATCKPLPCAVSSPQAPRRKPLPGAISAPQARTYRPLLAVFAPQAPRGGLCWRSLRRRLPGAEDAAPLRLAYRFGLPKREQPTKEIYNHRSGCFTEGQNQGAITTTGVSDSSAEACCRGVMAICDFLSEQIGIPCTRKESTLECRRRGRPLRAGRAPADSPLALHEQPDLLALDARQLRL